MDGRIDCIVERDCRMRRLVAPRQHHAESPAQPSHDVDVTPGDRRGHDPSLVSAAQRLHLRGVGLRGEALHHAREAADEVVGADEFADSVEEPQ